MKNIISICKFIWFIIKIKPFGGNPESILRVLQKFIELEKRKYSKEIINSRTASESSNLLSSLIRQYLKTHSETTLNQVIEVLKVEFIERGV